MIVCRLTVSVLAANWGSTWISITWAGSPSLWKKRSCYWIVIEWTDVYCQFCNCWIGNSILLTVLKIHSFSFDTDSLLKVNTEKTYVRELRSVVEYYIKPFKSPENTSLIPAHLRDRSDIVFGNIPDLVSFHWALTILVFHINL